MKREPQKVEALPVQSIVSMDGTKSCATQNSLKLGLHTGSITDAVADMRKATRAERYRCKGAEVAMTDVNVWDSKTWDPETKDALGSDWTREDEKQNPAVSS